MKKIALLISPALCTLFVIFAVGHAADYSRRINLPTGKSLTLPVPGFIARTNSFPATIAISPNGRYAALLNQGYGTERSGGRQSIGILDLSNNQLRDFPDDRLRARLPAARGIEHAIGLRAGARRVTDIDPRCWRIPIAPTRRQCR